MGGSSSVFVFHDRLLYRISLSLGCRKKLWKTLKGTTVIFLGVSKENQELLDIPIIQIIMWLWALYSSSFTALYVIENWKQCKWFLSIETANCVWWNTFDCCCLLLTSFSIYKFISNFLICVWGVLGILLNGYITGFVIN